MGDVPAGRGAVVVYSALLVRVQSFPELTKQEVSMGTSKKQSFAVAMVFGTGELDLRVYDAGTKEEALGLAFFDINLQSKLNTPKTYIADFKVIPAMEGGLRDVAIEELRGGNRIGAIKAVRSYTGWDLRTAKRYCDDLSADHPEFVK